MQSQIRKLESHYARVYLPKTNSDAFEARKADGMHGMQCPLMEETRNSVVQIANVSK